MMVVAVAFLVSLGAFFRSRSHHNPAASIPTSAYRVSVIANSTASSGQSQRVNPSEPADSLGSVLQIQSQSDIVNRQAQSPEIQKGVARLHRFLGRIPEKLREPVYSYVIATNLIGREQEWLKQRLEIEQRIQQLTTSDAEFLAKAYDPRGDSYINQRLLETIYKSAADRDVKVRFLVSRWFDHYENKPGVDFNQFNATITNSMILLGQLQPKPSEAELERALIEQSSQRKLTDSQRAQVVERLKAYLPQYLKVFMDSVRIKVDS